MLYQDVMHGKFRGVTAVFFEQHEESATADLEYVHLADSLCRLAAPQIKETTLLVLDVSDISKKYAKKMEYMGKVRDGSEKQIASGSWIGEATGGKSFAPCSNGIFTSLFDFVEIETGPPRNLPACSGYEGKLPDRFPQSPAPRPFGRAPSGYR